MDKANNRLGYQVGNPLPQRAEVRVGAGAGAGVKAGFRFGISISTSLSITVVRTPQRKDKHKRICIMNSYLIFGSIPPRYGKTRSRAMFMLTAGRSLLT